MILGETKKLTQVSNDTQRELIVICSDFYRFLCELDFYQNELVIQKIKIYCINFILIVLAVSVVFDPLVFMMRVYVHKLISVL